jgi:hypothetical protein
VHLVEQLAGDDRVVVDAEGVLDDLAARRERRGAVSEHGKDRLGGVPQSLRRLSHLVKARGHEVLA